MVAGLQFATEKLEAATGPEIKEVEAATMDVGEKVAKTVESNLNPEDIKWLDNFLSREYRGVLRSLDKFDFYNEETATQECSKYFDVKADKEIPSLEEVKAQILNSLSHAQMQVIKDMEKPTLVLVPRVSGERYLQAAFSKGDFPTIITSPFRGGADEIMRESDKREGIEDHSITGWKWAIVEGVKGLNEKFSFPANHEDEIKAFHVSYPNADIEGMDMKTYILLNMRLLERGRTVGDGFTVLNGEPVKIWEWKGDEEGYEVTEEMIDGKDMIERIEKEGRNLWYTSVGGTCNNDLWRYPENPSTYLNWGCMDNTCKGDCSGVRPVIAGEFKD